jgi:hypothetical protein
MLISHTRKFIYLKTRKTAGTSVEIYFEPFCIDPKLYAGEQHSRAPQVSEWGVVGSRGFAAEPWYNHMPAARILELTGEDIWNSYLKFCVIRNPFDKVVSWFWHAIGDEIGGGLAGADFAAVRSAFEEWTAIGNFPEDRFIYSMDGAPAVDLFIRYEHLADDLRNLCARLAVAWQPERLGRYKSEYRKRPERFEEYYTRDAARRVREAFAWEVDYFGYACAPHVPPPDLPEPLAS